MLHRNAAAALVLAALAPTAALGQFGGLAAPIALPTLAEAPHSLAIGDLDGDGDNDLMVVCQNSNSVRLLRNNGDGTFAAAAHVFGTGLAISPLIEDVALGRFDANGSLDALVSLVGTGGVVTVLPNNGNGTSFAGGQTITVGDSNFEGNIAVGDFDGDGDLDFVKANFGNGNVRYRLNNGAGVFSGGENLVVPGGQGGGHHVSVGDLNADGKADIVLATRLLNQATVLLALPGGGFASPVAYNVGQQPVDIAIADLDGDDDNDLAVYNTNSGTVSLLLNNGGGVFSSGGATAAGSAGGSEYTTHMIAAARMDADADTDLVVLNRNGGGLSVLLNNGNATFVRQAYSASGQLQAIALGDLWGDVSPDVAIARRETVGFVNILRNLTPVIAPGAFNLLAPSHNATNVMPQTSTFTWSFASGFGVSYTLRIATEPTFAAPVFTSAALGGATLPMPAGSLSPNTRYYWDVTATNPIGPTVASNAPFSFVTPVLGDVDGDGDVDFQDLNLVLSNYGARP